MTHSKTEVCDECYGETRREEKLNRDGALLCAAKAEIEELKAKLAIATEALQKILRPGRMDDVASGVAHDALKQIEETK